MYWGIMTMIHERRREEGRKGGREGGEGGREGRVREGGRGMDREKRIIN